MTSVDSYAWTNSGTVSLSILKTDRILNGSKSISGSAFIGQQLKTFSVYIKKTGSPSGTLYAKLYSDAVNDSALSSVIETSSTTISMSSIGTSFEQHNFTFSGDNSIAEDNCITLYFNGTGDDDNGVFWAASIEVSDNKDRTYQYPESYGNDVWEATSTGYNYRFQISSGSAPGSGGTLLPPPVAWVNV